MMATSKTNPCKVFVGNISYRVTFQELADFFSQFGPVEHAQVVKDHHKHWSRGIGFVTFKNAESALNALGASDDALCLDDRVLRVSVPRKPKRQVVRDECPKGGGAVESGECVYLGGASGHDVQSVHLNCDALIYVFSYLSLKDRIIVERVCKSWLAAARLLWKTVKSIHFRGIFKSFKGKYESLSDDILHSVLKRGCHGLRELDLSASPRRLSDYALDIIGMYCPRLEVLDLSGVSLTITSFKVLTQRCSEIKLLRLAGCYIGEKGLWWGLHNCTKLQSLDVTGNRRITGQCFYLIGVPPVDSQPNAKVKGHLKRLLLKDCVGVRDEGMSLLSQHNIPILEVVNMSHCQLLTGVALHSVALIRRIPEVEFVEEETMAHGAVTPWHIDRLDQQSLPLDNQFAPPNSGQGADIYILDSGINYDHEQFEYRAKYSGYDPTDALERTSRNGRDCHGHGTHVSSLAGGKTYGSAKGAQLYSVRVLNCNNAGPWSVVLDGLDYVARIINERNRPAVVSMSLSGGFTRSVNDAVQRMYNQGIHIVVAAGNSFGDACERSPASSSFVTTVGGSARSDNIYAFTNFGRCVNIYAPGSVIEGADHTCSTCTKTLSGTSMSAPLVSGVVASLLARQPFLTPAEMKSLLNDLAVRDILDFSSIPFQSRDITPNRLLHIPGNCGGTYSAATSGSIRTPRDLPSNPSRYPAHSHCVWTIQARPGQTVQLDFTFFSLELQYDVVRVCEGYSCSSVIGTPTGSGGRFFSRGEVMTVEMVTDGVNQFGGFQATYRSTGVSTTPTPPPPVSSIFTPPPATSTIPTTAAPTPATTTIVTTTVAPPTNSTTTVIDTCTPDNSQVPMLVSELLQEASVLIQKAVADSLSGFLGSRVIGLVPDYPADSCRQIAGFNGAQTFTSDFYYVRSSNGSAVRMYCELDSPQCACTPRTRGWARVADMDMRKPEQTCPSGLKEWAGPVRSCGRVSNRPGCSSMFIPTNGISYSRVCGKVIGYQYSSPNAFYAHQYDPEVTLEQYYVDGVSLTYGLSPRQHIWTFAAARSEVDRSAHICPCTNSANTLPDTAVPEFIGNDYFCDTGSAASYENGRFYSDDPLWDGAGCEGTNSCCDQIGSGYFCRNLGEKTTQDIELRICGNENTDNEDVPIEIVSMYVQ